MFPASVEDRLTVGILEPEAVDAILGSVQTRLEEKQLVVFGRVDNAILFCGQLGLRGSWWPVLGAGRRFWMQFGKSRIEVGPGEPGSVCYEFSTTPLLLVITVLSLTAGAAMLVLDGPSLGVIGFPVLIWLCTFGGNYLAATMLVPEFVRDAISPVVRGHGPAACPSCGTWYEPDDYRADAPDRRCPACGESLASGALADATGVRP